MLIIARKDKQIFISQNNFEESEETFAEMPNAYNIVFIQMNIWVVVRGRDGLASHLSQVPFNKTLLLFAECD